MQTTQILGHDLFEHDPQSRLDYYWDWTYDAAIVAGDTIASATVAAVAGLTIETPFVVGGVRVGAYISGGTLDARYTVVCHATSTAGRIYDRTLYLDCVPL